jgi:hypothetical protein
MLVSGFSYIFHATRVVMQRQRQPLGFDAGTSQELRASSYQKPCSSSQVRESVFILIRMRDLRGSSQNQVKECKRTQILASRTKQAKTIYATSLQSASLSLYVRHLLVAAIGSPLQRLRQDMRFQDAANSATPPHTNPRSVATTTAQNFTPNFQPT